MQPLNCDGGCGAPAQLMITNIDTGEVLALDMNCAADWAQALLAKRDQDLGVPQAGPVDQAGPDDQEAPHTGRGRPGPRRAARRPKGRGVTAAPSYNGADATTADGAGHDDSVAHGPTSGADLGGHHADDIATCE